MAYDVFVSYSRCDSVVADEICGEMRRNGISYFIDRRDIAGGMEFPEEIAEAIKESKLLLFLASRNSYLSRFTRNEILYALNCKGPAGVEIYIIDDSNLPLMFYKKLKESEILRLETCPIFHDLIDKLREKVGKSAISHVPRDVKFRGVDPCHILSHSDWALETGFSHSGTMVYSCGYNGDIKIFDRINGLEICTFSFPEESQVRCALFSSDDLTLFSLHTKNKREGIVAKWSIKDCCLLAYKFIDDDFCRNLIITEDGKFLVVSFSKIGVIETKSLDIVKEISLNSLYHPLIYGMGLIHNDEELIMGGDGMPVSKLSLQTHEVQVLIPKSNLYELTVNSFSGRFAVSYGERIVMYDIEKG